MKSVRSGLRTGEIERDTYQRLSCIECDSQLRTIDNPDELGAIRQCPECGRQWRQLA